MEQQLKTIQDVIVPNQNVLSRHKAKIGCCNFIEHEIERHARQIIPQKPDASREEVKTFF